MRVLGGVTELTALGCVLVVFAELARLGAVIIACHLCLSTYIEGTWDKIGAGIGIVG